MMEMESEIIGKVGGSSNSPDLELEEEEEMTLPGFRFHPTDEELVGFYLPSKLKKKKKRLRIDHIIKQVDIYKHDPWDLANGVGESEWYFFCLRGRKYRNSVRPNRVTGSGYWKATGIDKKIIFPSGSDNCIGLKKSLVYYCGKGGKGTKTYWMMHEFRLPPKETSNDLKSNSADEAQEAENWTICKIFKRNAASSSPSSPKKSRQVKRNPIPNHQKSPTSPVESVEVADQDDMSQSEPSTRKVQPHPVLRPVEDQQQVNISCREDQDTEVFGQLDCHLMLDELLLMENPDSSFCGFGGSLEELEYMNWEEIERVLEIQVNLEVRL